MPAIEDKRRLRQFISAKKKDVPQAIRDRENRELVDRIEEMEEFKSASLVLAYWPLPNEVDLRSLILKWYKKKDFLLPTVVGDHLELHFFEGENNLIEGNYGIKESSGDKLNAFEKVDLVLVPGLAFDSMGYRLGRGAGYYDRLLPKLHNAKKIGVGYSFQLVESVPSEPHDEIMDGVLTGTSQ